MKKQILKQKEKIVIPAHMQKEAVKRLISNLPENVHVRGTGRLEEVFAYCLMKQAGVIFKSKDEVMIGDLKNLPDITSGDTGVEVATRGYGNTCGEYGRVFKFVVDKHSITTTPDSPFLLEETLVRKQAEIGKYKSAVNHLYIGSVLPFFEEQLEETQKTLAYFQDNYEKHYKSVVCKLEDGLFVINKNSIEKILVKEPQLDTSGYLEICEYVANKKAD